MKITKYETAQGIDIEDLDAKVAKLISKGFQPYGNPCGFAVQLEGQIGACILAQAMVQFEGTPA